MQWAEQRQFDPQELWQDVAKYGATAGLSQQQVAAAIQFQTRFTADTFGEWLAQEQITYLTYDQPTFPSLLTEINDCPPLLWVKGNWHGWQGTIPIGVVGTRKMTEYGASMVNCLVPELVEQGAAIVSGFMYGVDVTAHQAAVASHGTSVGVLGFGFEHWYPRGLQPQAEAFLAAGGVLMTEYAPGIAPARGTFPQRNRLIAGMTVGTLVIEAGVPSGTMITAEAALDYGREVWAVPGPARSVFSQGTKHLINQGALLVTHGLDIIQALPNQDWSAKVTPVVGAEGALDQNQQTDDSRAVLEKIEHLLREYPRTSTELASLLKCSIVELNVLLTQLEIQGKVLRQGQHWVIGYNRQVR